MVRRATFIKLLLAVFAISIGSFVSYRYISEKPLPLLPSSSSSQGISNFDEHRDLAEVHDIFAKDRYWLLSSPDYDIDFAFKTHSPNKNEEKYKGKMTIKVCRREGNFIGFVTYYMKNFIEGTVLFLAIKTEFRGQRCGPNLMEYALNDLKERGAKYVTLVTRADNVKAQAVYKRLGFDETLRDVNYVYYKKDV